MNRGTGHWSEVSNTFVIPSIYHMLVKWLLAISYTQHFDAWIRCMVVILQKMFSNESGDSGHRGAAVFLPGFAVNW